MSLPSHYLITPTPDHDTDFLAVLERSLQEGTRLIQLKGKGMEPQAYTTLARKVIPLAHSYGARVLLSEPALVEQLAADGLHLDSKALKTIRKRPLPPDYLIAVSGHTLQELQQGEAIGADFAVLSPIRYTSSHPDIAPIGWQGLAGIVARVAIPIYALGGVGADDEAEAIRAGAQGVAGNKGYWKKA